MAGALLADRMSQSGRPEDRCAATEERSSRGPWSEEGARAYRGAL